MNFDTPEDAGDSAPRRPMRRRQTRRWVVLGSATAMLVGLADPLSAQRRQREYGVGQAQGGARRRRIIERFMRRDPEFRERAIRARRTGELRPLRELNSRLRSGGFELLDADLIETAGGWVYDIRVLGPNGRVRDVLIDGHTLRRLPDLEKR